MRQRSRLRARAQSPTSAVARWDSSAPRKEQRRASRRSPSTKAPGGAVGRGENLRMDAGWEGSAAKPAGASVGAEMVGRGATATTSPWESRRPKPRPAARPSGPRRPPRAPKRRRTTRRGCRQTTSRIAETMAGASRVTVLASSLITNKAPAAQCAPIRAARALGRSRAPGAARALAGMLMIDARRI